MSFMEIFGKDPRKIFFDFTPVNSFWRVVTWNFDIKESGLRRWTIEVHGDTEKVIHWEKRINHELSFYKGEKLIRKKKINDSPEELMALMNLAIHSTLKYGLETNHEFMVTPVSGATTMDIQNENRALLWIQATFKTLYKALDNVLSNDSMVLTAACFSGKTPDTNEDVLRLIVFNLDIFYYLREDKSLQIVVFDDKDMGYGESKIPTFHQIIKVTKPQFYDEITKLLHRLAQVGEIS